MNSSTAGQLEIRILGPLEIRLDGRLLPVRAPRLQSVLGSLLLRADEVVPVHHLVESIWEGDPPSAPANQVAACISMIRRRFTEFGVRRELVVTQPPGYRFTAEGIQLDTLLARQKRAHAEKLLKAGDQSAAVDVFKDALSLWRGPVLSGIWRQAWTPEVQRWQEEYVSIHSLCSEIQLELGMYEDLVTELSGFIERHPLLEHPRGLLMQALARSGRQADALQLYAGTARLLRDQLGVSPGTRLEQIHQQVLRGAVPSTAARQHVSGRAASAPVPVGGNTPSRPCQLPGDLAEFTGRDKHLAVIRAALDPDGRTSVPLVLLVGQGGTGKTALAVHAAHLMRSTFADGQLYVNLRGMRGDPVRPEEALGRFLRELGLQGPIPETLDERAATFRSLLADRRVLIVLDDVGEARQVLPLLPGTASCAVLLTSRARLATLPSTEVLELDVFETEQAIELLGRLAGEQRVAREPDVADRLIEYCGRLPLAVRIVGAKLASKSHWTLSRVASRLADERRRLDELSHDNLEIRTTLEMSHQGISSAARGLFRRLALVTSSDFADWVCAPLTDLPLLEAEELLEELLDARLLDIASPQGATQTRYRMHDLVRLFALEQLNNSEPREEQAAHLARLGKITLALADRAHRTVCGGDFTVIHHRPDRPSVPADILQRVGGDPLAWYESDRMTITALCQQLATQDEDELSWDLAATSRCLFSLRFHFDDWVTTHESALHAAERHGNKRGTAAMLLGLGDLHLTKRNYEVAIPILEEAQRLFNEVNDDYGHALALRKAGCADRIQGRFDRALGRWEECLPVLRAHGDLEAEAQVLRWTGQTLIEVGEREKAEEFLFTAREVSAGFLGRSAAQVRLSLGELYLSQGDLRSAADEFRLGLDSTARTGDLSGYCYALWGLGWVDVLRGRPSRAEEHLNDALDLSRRIHDPLLEADILLALATARRAVNDHASASRLLQTGAEICRRMDAPARLARFLEADMAS